jgi:hypothetical protein
MSSILLPYVHYVALYLGVALTGGSVVHLPLAPGRYLLIVSDEERPFFRVDRRSGGMPGARGASG